MIEAKELIKKITSSNSATEIFTDLSKVKNTYKEYSKLIHPDLCKEEGSNAAFTKLNKYKDDLTKGKTFNDDAGAVTYALNMVEFIGQDYLLKRSFNNWQQLMSFKDKSSKHFQMYLPLEGEMTSDNELEFNLNFIPEPEKTKRVIALRDMELPVSQNHVNWILSRMLEFSGWMEQKGFAHCGLNPDSIFIVPETHGIVITSFYHLTKLGHNLKTISAKWASFYGSKVFSTKIASPNIDTDIAKRIAGYLLGDSSGIGIKLKKTHNKDFINFLQTSHDSPFRCYEEYRKMLEKNFDVKKFHPLSI